MRRSALFSIRIYQRYLSPYKGFSCAYRCATNRASCSHLGYRAISRFGFFRGLLILESRTYKCGVANRRLRSSLFGAAYYQRGVCDAGCDAPSTCDFGLSDCDFFNSRALSGLADCACSFADCSSYDRSNKKKDGDNDVYIPPRAKENPSSAQERNENNA
jgi:uncharacterized protein